MRRRLWLLMLCFTVQYALGTDKIQISPDPSWLLKVQPDLSRIPSAKTISNGYYLELLDHQVNLFTNTEYTHFIRNIFNESGVQNSSEVSVVFSPDFQQVIFHRILLVRAGRSSNRLASSQLKVVQEETEAADFQYNGLKRVYLILKDVRKGDQIEVAYSIVGFNPVFVNKYYNELTFYNSTAITNYFETIIAPDSRKFSFRAYNNAPKPLEQIHNNIHTYHWDNPTLKIWESQPGTPSWYNSYPYVSVSEYVNWQEVINWGLETFKHYHCDFPPELLDKIATWRKTAGGDQDYFVNTAIRFVQEQIRYLGLEMGAYTHRPHSPGVVFLRRFGDCKDKSLLLAAILQHEKIHAYVALVNTVTGPKLSEALASPGEFDHAIVAIERSSGYIFVDPTVTWQRGELVNLFIPAYGYALVIKEGATSLEPVEPGFLYHTGIIETLDVHSNDSSSLRVVTDYSGGAADNARSTFADLSTQELEGNFLKYYAKSFDGIQQAAPVTQTDDSTKNLLTVHESYIIPHVWHSAEKGRESFDLSAKMMYEEIPNPSSSTPDAPFALGFPMSTHYNLEVNMPEIWSFPISELHIKNSSYEFNFLSTLEGRHISLHYDFKTFMDHIPAKDLAQFKEDYKKMAKKFEFQLYRDNESESKPSVEPLKTMPSRANWPAIWISFFLAMACSYLIGKLNKQRLEVRYYAQTGWPLGGWTIVLGITLGLSLIVQLIGFIGAEFYSHDRFTVLGEVGGLKLQLFLFVELTMSIFWLAGVMALLFWFFGRRDIFPRMFIWYMGSIMCGNLLLLVLTTQLPFFESKAKVQQAFGMQLLRTSLYGLIWIIYILRSERVKSTFLQPFKGRQSG